MNTTARAEFLNCLSDLELEYLHNVPTSGTEEAHAYACWERSGILEMGPVRRRILRTSFEKMGPDDTSDYAYDVSPFPGGWVRIPESAVRRVKHLALLPSLPSDSVHG